MSSIDRRTFLQHGSLGIGVGLAGAATVRAQRSSPAGPPRGVSPLTVRMMGDGVGLTPAEAAALWTDLSARGIERDAYSNGGVVEELEHRFAAELGKERAVFLPTGTLANHLAVRRLAARAGAGGRAVVQAESHLYNDSGDCVQTLSGVTLLPLAEGRATFTVGELEQAVARTESGRVARPLSVISIETPVRRREGETFDAPELDRVVAYARRHEIGLHLDGARLYLQSAYGGRSVADLAAPFDTVYVSLYKYFNAASGAILAGPRSLLDDLYHERRMFGAGLPGAWPFAAVALHYHPGFVDRLRAAIEVADAWMAGVARHPAFAIQPVPSGTNLFRLRVAEGDPAVFRHRLGERDVAIPPPRADGRTFLLAVNETWTRQSADALVDSFIDALG